MDSLTITLVLCSSFMHVSWNLLARRKRSEANFFGRMLALVALIGFLPAVLSENATHSLPPKAWLFVAGSGFFCGFYLFNLARAYESSDFTTVYPVARALPVFLVGIGDVLRGRYPTEVGWMGMLLVICGCFLAPLYSFRDFAFRSYINRRSLWMLFAALGTVGYTMLDKAASEIVQQGPATAARYVYMFFLIAFVSYTFFIRVFKTERENPDSVGWRYPILGAIMIYVAYWFIVWAYQLSQYASYILAFRQFSIIIGIVLGFAVYKESGKVVRLTSALFIAAGLTFIGLWGH